MLKPRGMARSALMMAIALSATTLCTGARADDRYEGTAYLPGTTAPAWRETHWRFREEGRDKRLVLFRCPGGEPFARKRVDYIGAAHSPDFEFVDGRDGYREGLRSIAGKREVFWQSNGKTKATRSPVGVDGHSVVDAGFDALIRQNWQTLAAGKSVSADFLLPSRQDFLPVKIATAARATGDPAGTLRLLMKADAWYGFIVPETVLVYRSGDRWLMRFEGIATIRNGKGKHQRVRIEFPPAARANAVPREEIRAAMAMPLAGKCKA